MGFLFPGSLSVAECGLLPIIAVSRDARSLAESDATFLGADVRRVLEDSFGSSPFRRLVNESLHSSRCAKHQAPCCSASDSNATRMTLA